MQGSKLIIPWYFTFVCIDLILNCNFYPTQNENPTPSLTFYTAENIYMTEVYVHLYNTRNKTITTLCEHTVKGWNDSTR
jgi:hypothetical protein